VSASKIKACLRSIPFLCAAVAFLPGCAGNRAARDTPSYETQTPFYTADKRALVEADSLIQEGNYESALHTYKKISNDHSGSPSGATAQYKVAYLNVHYDNPFADFDVALREFENFRREYPLDRRADRANNWIRILTVLKEYENNYNEKNSTLKIIREQQELAKEEYRVTREKLAGCEIRTDSLERTVEILQGVIKKLDALE